MGLDRGKSLSLAAEPAHFKVASKDTDFDFAGAEQQRPGNPATAMGTLTMKMEPRRNLGEQQAAGDRADGNSEADRPAPHTNGPGPLFGVAKEVVDY